MAKPLYVACIQCVHLAYFNWRSTWNPKCHMTFSNTKTNVNWHLHVLLWMSPQCHMPSSTCHYKSLMSQLAGGTFLHKSHSMSTSKSCADQSSCFFFVLSLFGATFCTPNVKNSVKNTPCLLASWSSYRYPNCHMTFSKTRTNVNWHLHFPSINVTSMSHAY